MARGLRKDTLDRIAVARERDPLALGPYLGELCVMANISASMIATEVKAHDQTVFRWFFGESAVQPIWAPQVSRLLTLFAWMHSTKRIPLLGTPSERITQLHMHAREFNALIKGGQERKLAA